MKVKQIGLSAITVSDLAKAKKFFVDTLGMKITTDAPEYQWLEVQGTENGAFLGIGQENLEYGSIRAGTNAIVSFMVDDLVGAKKELEEKGVQFFGEVMEIPESVKMAFFADADGNQFLLVEDLKPAK